MIKVSDVVDHIVNEDGFVVEAMQRGFVNLRAYAKQIQPQVEEKAKKPVSVGTIAVSLFRLAGEMQSQKKINPIVTIDGFSVTSGLIEVTYERTEQVIQKLQQITDLSKESKDFFTVTQGLHEITIICPEALKTKIIDHFGSDPKIVIDDLVAVSVRIPSEYMDIPNTIYSLVGILAIKHINLIEIVSTYTELSFVVYKNEMGKTIQSIDEYSIRSK